MNDKNTGNCGTPLFYRSTIPELTAYMALMLGTFDNPQIYPPIEHWNVETAVSYCLPEDGLPHQY